MTRQNNDPLEKMIKDDMTNGDSKVLRDKALDSLRQKQRSAVFIAGIYLLICILGMLFFANIAMETSSTRLVIIYGILFLVFFESTILIKLWYWVVHTRLSLSREMKILQLNFARTLPEETQWLDAPPESALQKRGKKIYAWFYLVVCLAVGGYFGFSNNDNFSNVWWETPHAPNTDTMGLSREVELEADGSGRLKTEYSFPNNSLFPQKEFSMYMGKKDLPPGYAEGYRDFDGNKLSVELHPQGQGTRTVVHLPKVVPPGKRMMFISEWTSKDQASREGDDWVFTDGMGGFGYRRVHYQYRIKLPPNVKASDISPSPDNQWKEGDRIVVAWDRNMGGRENFTLKLRYLPGEK